MGKIVTAYSPGQCEVNSEHAWDSGDEIYWHKSDNQTTVMCTTKACFLAQGGQCTETIANEVKNSHNPEPPKHLNKHTGEKTNKPQSMNDLKNLEDEDQEPNEIMLKGPKVVDAVDLAAKKMKEEYVTHAKEIKIIEEALEDVFPKMDGGERGMKTKLLWGVNHGR